MNKPLLPPVFTCRFAGMPQYAKFSVLWRQINAEVDKRTGRFAARIDNGHNGFDDVNTCILCIRLTGGVLFSHGTRYGIDFVCGKEG